MADVESGGGEVDHAAGVGRRHHPRPRSLDRVHLAAADLAGHVRMQRGVRAAGTATQAFVVELDESRQRRARAQCARARGRAARGAGGTGPAPRRVPPAAGGAAQAGDRRAPASHSCTSSTRALNARRGVGAEQVAVVLHRRTAPGRVDEDRRVAGHRRHHPLAPCAAASSTSPACTRSAPQQPAPPAADGSATAAPAASIDTLERPRGHRAAMRP